MNRMTNVVLTVVVVCLAALCYQSVSKPMRFGAERTLREAAVKERLLMIRAAEEAWRERTGVYSADFGELIAAGLLADSLQYVPYGGGRRFALSAGTLAGKGGKPVAVMECSAGYDVFLQGLDEAATASLTEEASAAGRFAGLKIGDLLMPNNNAGNWE